MVASKRPVADEGLASDDEPSTAKKLKTRSGVRKSSDDINSLIQDLNTELSYFDDNSTPLLSSQLDSYTVVYSLLTQTDDNLSKQRRSERARLRNLLTDVFLILGTEVFLLCAIAIPITKLSTADQKAFIHELRLWWDSSPRPRGLTIQAASLCSPVAFHLVSTRKQKFSDLGFNGLSLFPVPPLQQSVTN